VELALQHRLRSGAFIWEVEGDIEDVGVEIASTGKLTVAESGSGPTGVGFCGVRGRRCRLVGLGCGLEGSALQERLLV
jgi:hypothetical protein